MNINNNICRTCLLTSDEMFSLFSQLESTDDPTQLSDMLMACTTVQITSSDGLPEIMCRTCVIDLAKAYTFKQRCERSDAQLRDCLVNNVDMNIATSSVVCENNGQILICDKCNISFGTNEQLIEHLITCNGQNKVNFKLEMLEIEYPDIKDETVEYIEITSTQTDDDASNLDDKKQYYKVDDKYICVKCNASLSTRGNLLRHLKTHLEQPPNVQNSCEICKKQFSRTDSLTEHMKRHGNERQYKCELCDKAYTTKNALNSHIYTHDGKISKGRIHECQYCKKCFFSNSSLVIHVRTHTKEKPFLCQTCGKGFATRGGVDLHQRRHTGERPFKCEFCGRGFAESSNLKVHIRAHTGDRPHLCSLCGKRFTRMFLLQLHTRTHTGEKPYVCTDCPKAFAQQGDLAAHKRTHTGQRPHKCPLCAHGFIKSSGLKKHIQTRHAKDKMKLEKITNESQQSEDGQVEIVKEETLIKND